VKYLLLIALLIGITIAQSHAGEVELRDALATDVRYFLHNNQYEALERLHASLLEPDARTPSGVWKLAVFYNQLAWFAKEDTDPTYWKQLEARAQAWHKAVPDSTAAPIFLAQIYLSRAWIYRGKGWANEVRSEDWKNVREYAGKAYEILKTEQKIRKRDPSWYTAMINVLRLYQSEPQEFEKVLKEGMSIHPDYHEMYFAAAISLQPRWGGSEEAIAALANEAVRRTRDKEGEALYARIYWYMDQVVYKGDLFSESKASWARMRIGFNDLVSKYPDAWNLSAYAYFACRAEDYTTMSEVLTRIGDRLNLDAWGSNGKKTYVACTSKKLDIPPQQKSVERAKT